MLWIMLAAGNVYPWNLPVGRIVRWAALALLAAAALGYALTRGRPRRIRVGATPLLASALIVLAFVSTLWSPEERLTLGRATSLLTLFVAGWALGYGSGGRQEAIGQILLGLLAGAVAVAIGGLLNLWADPDRALVPATTGSPTRYNGLGGNPNTTAMLLAVALPLAAWAVAEARSAWGKAAAVGAFVLLDLSMTASGSRGAILAASVGLLALVPAFARERRRRVLFAAGATVLLAANLALTEIPPNADRDPVVLPPEFGDTRPISPRDLEAKLPLESEIGFPTETTHGERELLQTSGRAEAWVGALQQASERPLLGYGFGTEERVFVDRYYIFLSDRVENSFVGALLQLGIVGLAALGALLAVVLVGGLRAVIRAGPGARTAAACLGVVAAGLALAPTQSFMTSVGSPATPPFWLALALLATLTAGSGGRGAPART